MWLLVGLFGVVGVMARIWLDWAWYEYKFTKAGAYPSVFIPTNFLGSLIMGILVATKDTVFAR